MNDPVLVQAGDCRQELHDEPFALADTQAGVVLVENRGEILLEKLKRQKHAVQVGWVEDTNQGIVKQNAL